MKKRLIVLAAAALGVLATSGAILALGTANDPSKVGMAAAGPRNDHSFYEAHFIGLNLATKIFKLKSTGVDNLTTPQAQLDAIRNLARDNALVIGAGAEFSRAIDTVAKDFRDVQFVESAGVTKPAPNVHWVIQDWRAPGYVAGYIAAKYSKTKKVGFVGGALIPPTIEGRAGFTAGAKAANPKIKVVSVIVGSFIDPVKAKAASAAQIASGVDVIYGFLDNGFAGTIKAIQDSGKDIKTIGVILPQCSAGPAVLGDTLANIPQLIINTVRDFRANKLQNRAYGLEDPKVQRMEMCPRYRTPANQALIKKVTRDLVSGKIKLPKT